jgi:hypothetical protein
MRENHQKDKVMIDSTIDYADRLIHRIAALKAPTIKMPSSKRIFAYPATVLAVIIALFAGTTVAANANAVYGPDFMCEQTCAIINDDGQQVVRIKMGTNPPSRAYTDDFAQWIANHDNATIRVCVKARTNGGGLTPTVAAGGNLDPGEYWAVWLPNVWSGQYSVVCRNVFLPDGAAQRLRVSPSGNGDSNLLVRYVQLTVP